MSLDVKRFLNSDWPWVAACVLLLSLVPVLTVKEESKKISPEEEICKHYGLSLKSTHEVKAKRDGTFRYTIECE